MEGNVAFFATVSSLLVDNYTFPVNQGGMDQSSRVIPMNLSFLFAERTGSRMVP